MNKRNRKLGLSKETLRAISHEESTAIAGASNPASRCLTCGSKIVCCATGAATVCCPTV